MCLCNLTEHYASSTNEIENRKKEFSFADSQLFDFGVSKDDFARSAALSIYQNWDLDPLAIIIINLVKDPDGKNRITTYEYGQKTLKKKIADYTETLSLINSFVEDIYLGKYEACENKVDSDIGSSEFNSILEKVRSGLEEDYVNTRIVSYKKVKSTINIYGGVWTKNETLDLFRMTLKATEEGLRITSFEF